MYTAQSRPANPAAEQRKNEQKAKEEKKKRIAFVIAIIVAVLVFGAIMTALIKGTSRKTPVSDTGEASDVTVTDPDETTGEPDDTTTDVDESDDSESEESKEESTEESTSDTAEESSTAEETTAEPETTAEVSDTVRTDPVDSETAKDTESENRTIPTKTTKGYDIKFSGGAYYVTVGDTSILVANKTFALDPSYNPGSLTKATSNAFDELVAAAANDGIEIKLRSGFRSYSYQEKLYNKYVSESGTLEADRFSARPGHSEHQTGMAIDVNSSHPSNAESPMIVTPSGML